MESCTAAGAWWGKWAGVSQPRHTRPENGSFPVPQPTKTDTLTQRSTAFPSFSP